MIPCSLCFCLLLLLLFCYYYYYHTGLHLVLVCHTECIHIFILCWFQSWQILLETLVSLYPATSGTGVFWVTEPPIYYLFSPTFWLAGGGVQPVSDQLPLQSPMTDLKDSCLSLMLQITSSDMFGHADNVLSENSFQGWMGYKLSTPGVGYFFNFCFILLRRNTKGDQNESDESQSKANTKGKLWIKAFGTLSPFCLFHSPSGQEERRGWAWVEVCRCWHRRARTSGPFSSATVTGSTSAV